MVYVGPTVLGLTTRTIIGRTRAEHIQRMVDACPALERLIVPLSMMASTERAVRSVGSSAYFDAQDVATKFRKHDRR